MTFSPARLDVRLDPESPYVGGTVLYRVELERPEDVRIQVPPDLDVSPLTLIDVSAHSESIGEGLVREIIELELGVYTIDDVDLKGLSLEAVTADGVKTVELPAREMEVRSLVAEIGETPHELEPPDAIWIEDYTFLKAAGLLAVLLMALLLFPRLIRRLRRSGKGAMPAPPPPRPAYDVAIEALKALRDEGLVSRGEHKLFYFRLSEIVREYLGARYEFDSLELTTTELVARLRDHHTPGLDVDGLANWSAGCDIVKFARYTPKTSECDAALAAAFDMVEKSRPAEPDEESSGGDESPDEPGSGRERAADERNDVAGPAEAGAPDSGGQTLDSEARVP